MKFSNQALGAIMAALQNSLAHMTDIVPEFQGWNLYIENGEIFVENPPYLEVVFEEDDPDAVLDLLGEPLDTSQDILSGDD